MVYAVQENYVEALAFLARKFKDTDMQKVNTRGNVSLLSLVIGTSLNTLLIQLKGKVKVPNWKDLKQTLMRRAILLAKLDLDQKGAAVVAYNFEYTFYKFSDVIASLNLTNDFYTILSFFRRMQSTTFNQSELENEKDFSTELTKENEDWLNKVSNSYKDWVSIEDSIKIKSYQTSIEFNKKFQPWMNWYMKTIESDYDFKLIEKFEKALGIDA